MSVFRHSIRFNSIINDVLLSFHSVVHYSVLYIHLILVMMNKNWINWRMYVVWVSLNALLLWAQTECLPNSSITVNEECPLDHMGIVVLLGIVAVVIHSIRIDFMFWLSKLLFVFPPILLHKFPYYCSAMSFEHLNWYSTSKMAGTGSQKKNFSHKSSASISRISFFFFSSLCLRSSEFKMWR